MPDPHSERRSEVLHRAAAQLRMHADELPRLIERLRAYDRPDVWTGGRATAFRRGLDEQASRLLSPWGGAAGELRAAADRLEAKAGSAEPTASTWPMVVPAALAELLPDRIHR